MTVTGLSLVASLKAFFGLLAKWKQPDNKDLESVNKKYPVLVQLRDAMIQEPHTFNMRDYSTCAIGFGVDKGIIKGEWIYDAGYRSLSDSCGVSLINQINLDFDEYCDLFMPNVYPNPRHTHSSLVVRRIDQFLKKKARS